MQSLQQVGDPRPAVRAFHGNRRPRRNLAYFALHGLVIPVVQPYPSHHAQFVTFITLDYTQHAELAMNIPADRSLHAHSYLRRVWLKVSCPTPSLNSAR